MKAFSREKRHRIMAAVKSQDTKPERLLRLALWHRGIRYRKNWCQLTGKPDMVLNLELALFDGLKRVLFTKATFVQWSLHIDKQRQLMYHQLEHIQ